MLIGLAGVIEGIEISDRRCGKHTLELVAEHVPAAWHDTKKTLLLAEHQAVDIELAANQFRQHFGLQQLELIHIVSGQLDIYGGMKQRFTVPVHLRHDGRHILQVAFREDSLLQIVGIAFIHLHPVLIGGVADDLFFFHRRDMAGIDPQCNTVLFAKVPEDCLLIGGGRILPKCPNTTESIAADEMVGTEFNDGRCNHIKKFLNMNFFRLLLHTTSFLFIHSESPIFLRQNSQTFP